jgi:hypothetical protein
VECDGRQLHFAPGLPRGEAPVSEAPEQEWLACYRRVFGARARAAVPQDQAANTP